MIGITGGVGAGKSEILSFLEKQPGTVCIRADETGRALMEPGGACFAPVLALFGEKVLCPDGSLDRGAIAACVFADPDLREALNAVIHPAVKKEVLRRMEEERQAGTQWLFLEAALLIEDGYDKICDELWYVYADPAVRAERLAQSRGYTAEKTQSVMRSQLPDAVFRQYCSFVIDNSGDFSDTAAQMMKRIHSYDETGEHIEREQR